jgi:hypothetical protein
VGLGDVADASGVGDVGGGGAAAVLVAGEGLGVVAVAVAGGAVAAGEPVGDVAVLGEPTKAGPWPVACGAVVQEVSGDGFVDEPMVSWSRNFGLAGRVSSSSSGPSTNQASASATRW